MMLTTDVYDSGSDDDDDDADYGDDGYGQMSMTSLPC